MAENMPLNDLDNQSITSNDSLKQTMVDVDNVLLAGDCGAFRTP